MFIVRLSGLGVICGDGGNLRPQDSLTRAEAIVLVYKYLLSF
ncbi:MAG: S-layer homology domain-containing protein [Clostridia bacterium]|nr:S-layer homology domain-containing protein [Clostridia bacterium]